MATRHDPSQPVGAPHFSPVPSLEEVESLIRLASDSEVDFADLACELESRPGISSLIHRTANSVGMGTVREVRSLRHALAILGLQRVRAILFQVREDVSKGAGSRVGNGVSPPAQ